MSIPQQILVEPALLVEMDRITYNTIISLLQQREKNLARAHERYARTTGNNNYKPQHGLHFKPLGYSNQPAYGALY